MTRKLALALLAFAVTLALGATAALAASVRMAADPGVTSTSILLGGTAPLTGPSSVHASVARGAQAYFEYVNSRGGVNGRRIVYTVLDDASDPAQTLLKTRALVEQNGVFAIFNTVGTEPNIAIRDYLNQKKIPQIFSASGASALGSEGASYPYTIGLQPSYTAEGWVLGQYLARTQDGAKVAVLFEDDDYGRELLKGLRRGVARSKVKVVAAQPYDVAATDVQAQIARLNSSGANVLAVFASQKMTIEAFRLAKKVGWKPKLTLGSAVGPGAPDLEQAAEQGAGKVAKGTISVVFLKNPTDPRWRKDDAMKRYRKVMKQFAPGADLDDPSYVYGMAAAWTVVEAIRKAGAELTRDRLLEVVGSMNLQGNPFLLPGIVVKTGPDDRFPIDQMLLQRWHKGAWRSFGGLWGYRGG